MEPQTGAGRPYASWVMGRSARWHDPRFLAELERAELAERREAARSLLGHLSAASALTLLGGGGSAWAVLARTLARHGWLLRGRPRRRR